MAHSRHFLHLLWRNVIFKYLRGGDSGFYHSQVKKKFSKLRSLCSWLKQWNLASKDQIWAPLLLEPVTTFGKLSLECLPSSTDPELFRWPNKMSYVNARHNHITLYKRYIYYWMFDLNLVSYWIRLISKWYNVVFFCGFEYHGLRNLWLSIKLNFTFI